MKAIGQAEHLKIYYIRHSINDWVYFRFCNGKMKRAKIEYYSTESDGRAYFYVENTLKYYFDEIVKVSH